MVALAASATSFFIPGVLGWMADPDTPFASLGAIPLFLGLAVVGAVPLYFYLRHLHRAEPARLTATTPRRSP